MTVTRMCSSSVDAKISLIALIAIGIIIRGIDARPPLIIRGGENAAPNEFPWVARLNITIKDGVTVDCGGAIISPRHILTAAHCLEAYTLDSVWTGYHIRDFNLAVKSTPAQMIMHPNYTSYLHMGSDYTENDVGIVTLDNDLKVGANQNVILLADKSPSVGTRAVFAGWGMTNEWRDKAAMVLQKTSIVISSTYECPKITSNQLCGLSPPNAAPCNGDSGSSLAVDGRVVGVRSTGGCLYGQQSTYTNILIMSLG